MSSLALADASAVPLLRWEDGGPRLLDTLPRPSKCWLSRTFKPARGREFQVTVGVIKGAKPGPVFTNVAGQHGMEHVGPMTSSRNIT